MSLESLIADVLAVDVSSLSNESSRETLSEWDSVAHLNVISAIEETFDVMFSSAEMRELSSIGRLRAALASKGFSG